jgi:hypothetical protein
MTRFLFLAVSVALATTGCTKETGIHLERPVLSGGREASPPDPANVHPQQARLGGAGNIADVAIGQDNGARRQLEKERMNLLEKMWAEEHKRQQKKMAVDAENQKMQADLERRRQEALDAEKEARLKEEQDKKLLAKAQRDFAEINDYAQRNYKDFAGIKFYTPRKGADKTGVEGILYWVRIKQSVVDLQQFKRVPKYTEVVFFVRSGAVAGFEKTTNGYNSLKKFSVGEEIELPTPPAQPQ